ncbi:hypothetical protein [Rhodoferax ferrireducens]|uniref:hypothetical protein n=1 Tax=Rhodoferax ferrireducens TaxID=192843 RepID=UPI0005A25011|nr:hypothetical protein [Rhodoferax ferrireducens]
MQVLKTLFPVFLITLLGTSLMCAVAFFGNGIPQWMFDYRWVFFSQSVAALFVVLGVFLFA